MRINFLFLVIAIISNISYIKSQPEYETPALRKLDKTYFGWKGFSFAKPFDKLDSICNFEKITQYPLHYLNFYCGKISDTNKSYYLSNLEYKEFNSISFDYVILNLSGSVQNNFQTSTLTFIKNFDDSQTAFAK